jgi:hypothetical protein
MTQFLAIAAEYISETLEKPIFGAGSCTRDHHFCFSVGAPAFSGSATTSGGHTRSANLKLFNLERVGRCGEKTHAAATTWAIAAPEHVGISRDLLAHTDLRMTTKYYNRAKGIEASRAHGHIISRLKRRPHHH